MIALVGCVKTKVKFSTTARELYLSPLFKKTVRLVESMPNCEDWFILSAKHGLIEKEKHISPYETSLLSFSQSQLKEWSQLVYKEIKRRGLQNLYFYCGSKYHNKYLLQALENSQIEYHLPLLGKSLGNRLKYLNLEYVNTKRKGFGL